jgi:hypothetical protein
VSFSGTELRISSLATLEGKRKGKKEIKREKEGKKENKLETG